MFIELMPDVFFLRYVFKIHIFVAKDCLNSADILLPPSLFFNLVNKPFFLLCL